MPDRSHFLSHLAAATEPLIDAAEVMSVTAMLLAEHLEVDRCAYAEVDNEETFVITGDFTHGVNSIVGRWPVAAFGPECVRQMLAREAYVVEDSEHDSRIGPADLPAYRATQICAVICVPLHKGGKFSAAMAVHQKTPRQWTKDEISLVGIVVARCWETLERARSESRYRAIVEASPECVMTIARDGTLLQLNPAGHRMFGMDLVGRRVHDFVAPEDRTAFSALNEKVCGGESGTLTFDIVGPDGTRRTLESNSVPLNGAQLAVTRDVTLSERNRTRLGYAMRLSGIGFWYCNLPFDELIWDARVKEHFFLPVDARVTIELFYERIHPDDRAATKRAIDDSIENHSSYDVVYRTVDPKTQAIKYIRALGGTTYTAEGQPAHFDGVTVDVSAQRRDQDKIAEQARLLAKVAHAALTVHASASMDSVIRVVTEEARRIIGAQKAVTRYTPPGATEPIQTLSHLGPPIVSESKPLSVPFVARDGEIRGSITLFQKREGSFNETDESI